MHRALHQRIRRTIARHDLCPPGSRVLVALSGGSDSVALTLLLRDLARHGGFDVVALAHLNHQLRPTAGRDEQFCRQLAASLGLPISVEALDVAGYARSERLSIEDGARRLRYDFLSRAASQHQADRIAVGHTQDDQAETVLLRLMRGAGLTGLGGIPPRRGAVIRPLLDCSKSDLQGWLRGRGQAWVEDESNAGPGAARNRVRHRVLPILNDAAGGDVRPALARAAGVLREDGEWLDALAERRFAEVIQGGTAHGPDSMILDASLLVAEPAPIRRRIILRALRDMAGDREIGLEHVESVSSVLAGLCAAADLPGCRVELRAKKLVLSRQEGRLKC